MRHVVMISQIPLWSMDKAVGGPAFAQTVAHLAEKYRVSLVQPQTGYVEAADLPANVTLHPFEHRFHGALRNVPKLGWVADTAGWYTFRSSAWPTVERLCEAGDVDLVYGYEIYGTPVARRAADKFGLPMVARFQGTLMSERRKMRAATLRFWKHVRGLSVPADLIVMTNDGTLGLDYLLSIGQPADKIRFWMNGVDRSILDAPRRDVRAELGIAAGTPLLLTVSRLSFWKRVDRSLRLLAELAGRGSDAHLVVVGAGPEESRLRELTVALGLAGRVTFAGGVSRSDLASYYDSADAVLSLYDSSNLGNPSIEAMLLGRPLVAYDVGGTTDLVVDGVNGILVRDPDDASALADTVGALLGDEARRHELGASAAAWATENLWSWDDRMAAEIADLDALMSSWEYRGR